MKKLLLIVVFVLLINTYTFAGKMIIRNKVLIKYKANKYEHWEDHSLPIPKPEHIKTLKIPEGVISIGPNAFCDFDGSIDTLELVRAKEKWPSFSSALDTLLKHGKLVLEKSKELSPNEVELEFGIKGGIEAGIPVWGLAKASSEGNITVKMHWKDKTSK